MIDELRLLDCRIATQVMGQVRTGDCGLGDPDCPGKFRPLIGHWGCLPPYSTDIAAAWTVLEHLIALGLEPQVDYLPIGDGIDWTVTIERGRGKERVDVAQSDQATAPLAICWAALGALAEVAPPGEVVER